MGKQQKQQALLHWSESKSDELILKVERILRTHANTGKFNFEPKSLDKFLKSLKNEDKAKALQAILHRNHRDMAAKATAILSRATSEGFHVTIRKETKKAAEVLSLPPGSAQHRSASAPAKKTGYTDFEGLDLYLPSIAQFKSAEDESLPVLRKATEVIPGKCGVIVLKGNTFMEVHEEPGRFLAYSGTLVALIPAGKNERHIGNNAKLHDELRPQATQVIAVDSSTRAGYRPIQVWAVSLTKKALQLRASTPSLQLNIDKMTKLTLQIKKDFVPQECFDALLEDTKREYQEVWKMLTTGVIHEPPA